MAPAFFPVKDIANGDMTVPFVESLLALGGFIGGDKGDDNSIQLRIQKANGIFRSKKHLLLSKHIPLLKRFNIFSRMLCQLYCMVLARGLVEYEILCARDVLKYGNTKLRRMLMMKKT